MTSSASHTDWHPVTCWYHLHSLRVFSISLSLCSEPSLGDCYVSHVTSQHWSWSWCARVVCYKTINWWHVRPGTGSDCGWWLLSGSGVGVRCLSVGWLFTSGEGWVGAGLVSWACNVLFTVSLMTPGTPERPGTVTTHTTHTSCLPGPRTIIQKIICFAE